MCRQGYTRVVEMGIASDWDDAARIEDSARLVREP
jgi:hypothetical protein